MDRFLIIIWLNYSLDNTYYLLACKDMCINNEIKGNMSIWRIDLMTEIEIPGRNDKLKIPGIHVLRKEDVDGLPINWDDFFQLSHLNMSYDKPINIKLKIKSPKKNNNPSKRVKVDYTFMYDCLEILLNTLKPKKRFRTMILSKSNVVHLQWLIGHCNIVIELRC
ncbi:hypothetical protein SDC9_71811 [bioreactor metagenome]|uniref:Uncharacterized protein n=1 Tax=bioreactor metagenome TaxID=1076179 RepID=A0A644YA07_9ZZZZ